MRWFELGVTSIAAGVFLLVGGTVSAQTAKDVSAVLKTCEKCHGSDGISKDPLVPNLAGQRIKYLEKQISDFQRSHRKLQSAREDLSSIGGERRHPDMGSVVAGLSGDMIKKLAEHYAFKACALKSSVSPVKADPVAEKCLACHGEAGTEHTPWVPSLNSQKKLYLINQIYALQISSKFSEKTTSVPRRHPVMENQVRQLDQREVEQVAAYFSGLACR